MPPVSLMRDVSPRADVAKRVKRRSHFTAPRWLRTLGRHKLATLGAAALGAAVAGSTWAWHTGKVAEARDLAALLALNTLVATQVTAGLVVNEVTVEGRTETAGPDLLAALGVQRGDLLLGFDANGARTRIEHLGWIHSARVSRRLPDRIHVEVTERIPFALWQSDRRLTLIDREGAVITDRGLGQFSSLPMVVGADAAPLAGTLIDMLAQVPSLHLRVRAAVRIGKRRWDIHFDNGVVAKLPEEGTAAAWSRLADLDGHYRILDRAVQIIDLRLGDRLVLRMEPPAPPRPPGVKPKAPQRPA
jgi:cell division protein FtsQ